MYTRSLRPLAFALLALLTGCSDPPPANPGGPVSVFVSIPPQVFFAERIGGEQVKVESLVTAGSNPHTFAPTPSQMTRLVSAELFLAIGVEFEMALLKKMRSAYPNLTIVETQAGIMTRDFGSGYAQPEDRRPVPSEDAAHNHTHENEDQAHTHAKHSHAHSHEGQEHEHDHDHSKDGHTHEDDEAPGHNHYGGDPHVWLDPMRAKRMARNVCAALAAKAPEHQAVFLQNLEQLERELDALHTELAGLLEPHKGKSVFVYHPAYGYLTDLYGLEQVPVEVDGRSPTASELAQLVKDVEAAAARVIYYEPQFDRSNVQRLAEELGLNIQALDPLASDYMENMRRMARALVAGWSSPS